MQMTGNTILITGGGSGIGRGLAEALQRDGNHVIIAGRRRELLDEVVAANPGMNAVELDIDSAEAIQLFAAEITDRFPKLNVVIQNAGIMRPEKLREGLTDTAEATISTNLLGPIRLTEALMVHLLKQPRAAILTVTSGLAFMPLAATPTYCATKAAIHSWTQSLRFQLRGTSIDVIELIPPYVQTELTGPEQKTDERAMPLKDYIDETMHILRTQPDEHEVRVGRVLPQYNASRREDYTAFFEEFNERMSKGRF